jgi:hypothetical protein
MDQAEYAAKGIVQQSMLQKQTIPHAKVRDRVLVRYERKAGADGSQRHSTLVTS